MTDLTTRPQDKLYKNPIQFHNIKKNARNLSTLFAILRYLYLENEEEHC